MSAQLRKKSGRGAAAEPPAYAEEQPSPRKPLSLYRRPPGKKKERTDRAKRAVLIRWGRTEAAAAISAGEGRTVQWGKLCTLDAMASTTPAVEHLRALGVLKAAPAAGSLRLRAVAAAVLAAELGGPEHGQLGALRCPRCWRKLELERLARCSHRRMTGQVHSSRALVVSQL